MERESRILVVEEEIDRERKIKQEREEMEKEMVTRERCLNKEKKGREWETLWVEKHSSAEIINKKAANKTMKTPINTVVPQPGKTLPASEFSGLNKVPNGV